MKKLALIFCALLAGVSLQGQNVGIDQPNPTSKLDINGGLSVGSGYSGIFSAPSNGAIFEGQVGIGIATPAADLDVNGSLRVGNLVGTGTRMVVTDDNGNLMFMPLPAGSQNLSLSGNMLNISSREKKQIH